MSWKDNPIMYWNGEKVSDHSRTELAINTERIERKDRMIDGTMRRYRVATKRTFSTSWSNLPSTNWNGSGPVDGGMTASEMSAFLNEVDGPFTMTLSNGQGETEVVDVYLDDFSYQIVKRGLHVDLWNLSVSLVEV